MTQNVIKISVECVTVALHEDEFGIDEDAGTKASRVRGRRDLDGADELHRIVAARLAAENRSGGLKSGLTGLKFSRLVHFLFA